MTKPTAIIFDLGNVMVRVDYSLSIPAVSQLFETQLSQEAMAEKMYGLTKNNGWSFDGDRTKVYEEYHSGEISSEEFIKAISTGLTWKPGSTFQDLQKVWPQKFAGIKESIELLPQLSKHQRFILSDTNEMDANYLTTHFPQIFEHVDEIFFSHQKHVNKYSLQAWKQILDMTGLPPENHVFVDDKADHVERAKQLGIQGIVFTDPSSLKAQLLKLGYLND